MTTLGEFEGAEVAQTSLRIRNTGDGLSNAMKVAPVILHKKDKVFIVLECLVSDVAHPDNKDDNSKCDRVHVLTAKAAVLVDEKLVAKALAAQRAMLDKLKEVDGQERLPGTGRAAGVEADED